MPVSARERFERGLYDVDRLMEIHAEIGGTNRGQRVGLEPLNRSAIVLLTAVWEGFVEDMAAQALQALVDAASDPDKLPERLRTIVARELKSDPHTFASWKLAGDKWKSYLQGRLPSYANDRARGLNTPDSKRVETLFDQALGLQDVTEAWHWKRMTRDQARAKLDNLIKRRGDVAHGGEPSGAATVQKAEVQRYKDHVVNLAKVTEGRINEFLKSNGVVSI